MKGMFVVLALTALAAAPAAAEVVSNAKVDISGGIINPCNGETVTYEGASHVVFRATLDASGGIHLGIHLNTSVKGTGGTTGAKYSASEVINQKLNLTAAGTETVVHRFKLNGQGQVPNFTFVETLHITVNANGDVTVDRTETSAECN